MIFFLIIIVKGNTASMDEFLTSYRSKKMKLDITASNNSQKIKQKCRKYDKYLDFGFNCTTVDDEERP